MREISKIEKSRKKKLIQENKERKKKAKRIFSLRTVMRKKRERVNTNERRKE